jgi:P-type Ca2+ transporter type 2C
MGFTSNRMFNYALAFVVFGQLMVVYFPPLQNTFQTTSLSIGDWLYLILISSTIFLVEEGRKRYYVKPQPIEIGV